MDENNTNAICKLIDSLEESKDRIIELSIDGNINDLIVGIIFDSLELAYDGELRLRDDEALISVLKYAYAYRYKHRQTELKALKAGSTDEEAN